jgi:hypothetical protein
MTSPQTDYRTLRTSKFQTSNPEVILRYPNRYDVCPNCGGPKGKRNRTCAACWEPLRLKIEQPLDPAIKYIALTCGYFAVIDAEDFAVVNQYTWFAHIARRKDGEIIAVYAACGIKSEDGRSHTVKLHRFIMKVSDPKIEVDHWDHNGLNCRRYNLRVTDRSGNIFNRRIRRDNSSGFKGVRQRTGYQRWKAMIGVEKRRIYLGDFASAIEAARAYDVAALQYHKEFALTNVMLGLLPPLEINNG